MKIYEILPGQLYQSRTTVGMAKAVKYEAIDKLGITVVANLWSPKDPDIEDYVETYLDWPMPDGKYPDFDLYNDCASDLAVLIKQGEMVLTHCHAGRNRSGLLNAMVVMMLTGRSGKQAKEYIQVRRPGALANQHFCDLLDDLIVQV